MASQYDNKECQNAASPILSYSLAAWSALLQRAIGWGYLTFPSFLEELEILGLKGKIFGPNEYAHALAAYLDIQIAFETVDDADDPRSARGFIEAGHTACL